MNLWKIYDEIMLYTLLEISNTEETDFWTQFNDEIDLNISLNENNEWEVFAFPLEENGNTDSRKWIQIGGYIRKEIDNG